jgi:hypothetical protein
VSFRFLNNICSRRGCSIFCFAKEEEEEEVVVVVVEALIGAELVEEEVVVVVVEALIGAELEEEDLASDEDGKLETSF